MKRFVWLGLVLGGLAACGDDSGDDAPIDARVIDAAAIDADNTDADDTDAPPAVTYSGSVSFLEAAVLNPGTSGTFFGQGVQIGISFTASDALPGPVMEEMPGSPLGCKAWEYTPPQVGALLGIDEGSVQVTLSSGTPYPACTFQAGIGYFCPHTGTQSTGGIIAAGPQAGTATLTDADTTFNATNSTNRYVRISGATNAANNGAFPILAVAGANTIVYGNPAVVAETIPATGGHINVAGVGPTPQAPDPGFLADDATFMATLTSGGGGHIATFTSNSGTSTVGDDFTLDIADANRLNALPLTGAAFTIACGAGSCINTSASGSILNIVTTDGPTAGQSPFAMPTPTTKRVQIRCAALGQSTITVPAAFSALLMSSGATRIQSTFIRPLLVVGGPGNVNVVAGHAIVGFTNP
jgi:hypothetical protein